MSLRDLLMAAVAALVGGLIGAYVLDSFPAVMRDALAMAGLQPAAGASPGTAPADYAQFAAGDGDSDATIKDKKERCWVMAYAAFPTIARRIPFKDGATMVRDNAFPSPEERAQFKAFASVIPVCRRLTRAYDERTIPPTQQALLAKLDQVFAEKDELYQSAIDGTVRWGDFAQRIIDIERDLAQFRQQMKAQPQTQ